MQVITGKGASVGYGMGAPGQVRHLRVKRISKDTNGEDVWMMMMLMMTEQNRFTIKELKCTSHSEAQFISFKLAVHPSEISTNCLMKICGQTVSLCELTGQKCRIQIVLFLIFFFFFVFHCASCALYCTVLQE